MRNYPVDGIDCCGAVEALICLRVQAPELCGNEVAILDAWGAVSGLQGDTRQAAVEQWRAYQQTHKTVEYGMLVDVSQHM